MASIGNIKVKKRFISGIQDGPVKGLDLKEYTEPFFVGKTEVMQFQYDHYSRSYWLDPDWKDQILELSKAYYKGRENDMIMPIPSNPECKTEEKIEEAYIYSLIYEIRTLTWYEKEFQKAVKAGYTAVGFAHSSQLKLAKGSIKEAKQALHEAGVAECWMYFSLDEFTRLNDFEWKTK